MLSNARKNAIASYANTALTAVAGFVVSPLLLNALGATTFGAWKAMQRLLDVGASAGNGGAMQSLKWVVAHRSNSVSDEEKRRDVGAAIVVLLYWSPILIAVTAAVVALLPRLIRDVDDTGMIYLAGAVLGLNVVLMSFAAMPDAVLIGTNQGFRSTNISTAVIALNNAGMVAAAVVGLGPLGMAAALTLGTAINGSLTFLVLRKRVSWWGFAKPSRRDVRRLSGFSGWIFAWSVMMRLSDATEVIVLGAIAGATAVSAYTFTSYAVLFAAQLCWLTSTSLAPQLGSFVGSGQWAHAQRTAREMRELCLALATGTGAIIILLNQSFVQVWAGREQFMGQAVNLLMVAAFVQYVMIFTDSKIQDTGLAIGPKVVIGTVMTVAAIAAGGGALALSGSVEIMFVTVITVRIIGNIGFPVLANRVIQGSGWPMGRVTVSVVILAVSLGLSRLTHADTFAELIVFGLIITAVMVPAVFLTMLSPPTRRKILGR